MAVGEGGAATAWPAPRLDGEGTRVFMFSGEPHTLP